MSSSLPFIRSYSEAGTVHTFVFATGGLSWQPGQYQTYRLIQAGDGDAGKRFFTIASAPSEDEIHISTRVTNSSFKQALSALKLGDFIVSEGSEGDFVWKDDSDAPVIFVAAGIGSTPYRSMLLERQARAKPLNATLIYFSRDDAIPFKEEFDKLAAAHEELTITYIVGEPVSAAMIMEHVDEAQPVVYLSGPEGMVDTIGGQLTAQGVTLKQDWFPGYTEDTF